MWRKPELEGVRLRQGLSLSTRLTIAIVTLVVVTAGTVGFLSYRNIAAIAIPRAMVRLDAHARAVAVDGLGLSGYHIASVGSLNDRMHLVEVASASSMRHCRLPRGLSAPWAKR